MRPISTEEVARRAAIWAATLRDDAANLLVRAKTSTTTSPEARRDLVRLSRALDRAATVLDAAAGKKRARTSPRRRR